MTNSNDKPLLLIIDGNSFMHRAFHALPSLANSDGFPTGAITGVLNMISSAIKKNKPDQVVVSFDAKGKTFRDEIADDYKAGRPPTHPDLKVQFGPIKEIITAWGIYNFAIEGVESDDSIGTLATKAVDKGYRVIVGTSDKDMMQIVSEDIWQSGCDSKDKEGAFGPEGVCKRLGVYPERVRDFLTLVGDKVDNVKGVNKVGPKIAVEWLEKYGTLNEVMAHADEIKGKRGEYLRYALSYLPQSYELVTLKLDVDLGIELEDMKIEPDEAKLYDLALLYGLSRFKKDLNIKNPHGESLKQDIVYCDTNQKLDNLKNKLTNKDCFQWLVDVHTVAGEKESRLLIAPNNAETVYVTSVYELSNLFLEKYYNETLPTLVSNDLKTVLTALIRGWALPPNPVLNIMDSRLVYSILNGAASKLPSIDDVNTYFAEYNLNADLDAKRKKFKLGTKDAAWDKLSLSESVAIKAEELLIAYKASVKVTQSLKGVLEGDKSSEYDIDSKMLPILATMEATGVLVDKEKLETLGRDLDLRITNIVNSIKEQSGGEEVNLNSPKAVAHLLYDVLGIPSKTKSTAVGVLNKLEGDYPIISDILLYRSLAKLKSTYVTGLIDRSDDYGYVYPKFNLGLTASGRLSAEDPNTQAIPVRSDDGKRVRDAFIAPDGFSVVALDFSQIELRVVAARAKDIVLINAFKNNIDVHSLTASEIFGCDITEVTDGQRRSAKAVNFGLIYGISANGLSRDLKIPKSESTKILSGFSCNHQPVFDYLETQLEQARANNYIETMTGRKVKTLDVNSPTPMIRAHGERFAKNASIQGTAADIIKKATIACIDSLRAYEDFEHVRLVMQVHDELVFYVRNDIAEETALKLQTVMETSFNLGVPMVVDLGIGGTWLEAH